MAIDTDKDSPIAGHTIISTGNCRSIVTDKATYLLHTGRGKVGQLMVGDVGSSWTIDIYDALTAVAGKKLFAYTSALGVGPFALQVPIATGITIVSGGTTAGVATLVWEDRA